MMNNITTGIPGTNRCGKAMMMVAGLLLLGVCQPSISSGQQSYQMEKFVEADQLVEAKVNSEYRLVSLDLENVTLTSALRQLAQQGKVGLSFQPEQIPDKKVTVKLDNIPFYEALDELLKDTNLKAELPSSRDVLVIQEQEDPSAEAVQHTVTGTVTDSNTGEPLPGVNVLIQGTSTGMATDVNGEYSLEVPGEESVLVFSFVGFQTQEITVGSQEVIDVSLQPDLGSLEEMVVVGYSAVKKSSLTASVSKVENEKLDQIPVSRPENALVGRLSGVNISQTRNRPGDAPNITIRGPGSISANNNPLIVIDGFPGGSFNDVNMNDIESIEVLKDASSAAIYGSRGAGGVIIITTKQGQNSGAPQFSLNTYYGIADPMLHGEDAWVSPGQEFYEYTARYVNRDWYYSGGDHTLPLDSEQRDSNYRPGADEEALKSGNYNWEDILFDPAPIQNYNLSVSGGNDRSNYYLSGTFKDEEGTYESTSYRQYALRASYDVDLNETFSAGIMLNPQYSHRRLPAGSLQNQVKFAPFVSPEPREDGTYYRMPDYISHVTASAAVNPMAALRHSHFYNHEFNNNGEAYLTISFLDNLELRSSVGAKIRYQENERFVESRGSGSGQNSGSEYRGRLFNLVNENILTYNETFNDVHDFTGMLGASFQHEGLWENEINAVSGSFANESIHTLNNAVINPGDTFSEKTQWGLASYFSRVNYGYDEKYLVSASIRTDGSSRFGPSTRWGYFPSDSAAWRVTEENFMSGLDVVNELKLRASYGVTGNFNIGNFAYLGTIGDYAYSPGGVYTIGQSQNSFGNPDLKWERTYSYDIGVELGLFNNRLNFIFDYYDKTTKDLLYSVNTPAVTGFTSSLTNVGDINNSGVELEINTVNIQQNDFYWSTSFNYTNNNTKVTNLGGGVTERTVSHSRGMSWILREGESMFSYYGHRMLGVIQSEEELAEVPTMAGQPVGTVRMDDINDDGVINNDDRVILGNFMPDFYLGMVNEVNWRNFDLSVVMQASIGGKKYNLENL
ncbi:MAG TPA: SusC/RagA family TonB-linked outer membrane protein, partial [Fodinibius sp.]|nr:SusC/RagA family TonB-linked outer membrane protein [Fodinibius sp.]